MKHAQARVREAKRSEAGRSYLHTRNELDRVRGIIRTHEKARASDGFFAGLIRQGRDAPTSLPVQLNQRTVAAIGQTPPWVRTTAVPGTLNPDRRDGVADLPQQPRTEEHAKASRAE